MEKELTEHKPINYKVVQRPVRRPRLEYTRKGLMVIVPQTRTVDVPAFIEEFRSWILKKRDFYEEMAGRAQEITLHSRTEAGLMEAIRYFVAEAESAMNVSAAEIRLRAMKRQWGNCTNRGRLTFNKRLARLPDHLVRYIVFHEACHLKSLRHGMLFRKTMRKFFPTLREHEKELSVYSYRLGLEE